MTTLILVAAVVFLILVVPVGLGVSRKNAGLLLATNGLMLLAAIASAAVTYSFWATRDVPENWAALYVIFGVWPVCVIVLLMGAVMLAASGRLPAPEASRLRVASLVNMGLMVSISLWGLIGLG